MDQGNAWKWAVDYLKPALHGNTNRKQLVVCNKTSRVQYAITCSINSLWNRACSYLKRQIVFDSLVLTNQRPGFGIRLHLADNWLLIHVLINSILFVKNKIKGGVSFIWNNNTVEVNLIDHVDRWVGYDKSCIRGGACNLYYRVKAVYNGILIKRKGKEAKLFYIGIFCII